MKNQEGLLPDYFQNIINREIYYACLETDDTTVLKEKLEPVVREKIDAIISKHTPPAEKLAARFADSVLALRKTYLMNQEAMRGEVFAMEAETGGTGAALARLQVEGIEPSVQLKDAFASKRRVIRRANGRRSN
jgi:hypothetical protein